MSWELFIIFFILKFDVVGERSCTKVIEFFVELNYKFVTPQEIYNGLNPNENHIFLTFDDGYFSNSLALPILKFFNVPATFFISSNHILKNKCFWWDIIYRERIKQGYSRESISKEISIQKTKKYEKIEEYIIKEFGKNAFKIDQQTFFGLKFPM